MITRIELDFKKRKSCDNCIKKKFYLTPLLITNEKGNKVEMNLCEDCFHYLIDKGELPK